MVVSPAIPHDDSEFLLAGMDFVTKIKDPKVAIEKLVTAAAAAIGSDMGSFFIIDEAKQVLEPFVTVNFPPAYAAACCSVPLGEQCCGCAALYKHPWIVEDMWSDPLFKDASEGARKAGIRAGFSVPVLDFEGKCLGSLAAHFRSVFRPTGYDLERQSLFAKLIAFSLTNHQYAAAAAPFKVKGFSPR
jgi:GAF domain-containing protein